MLSGVHVANPKSLFGFNIVAVLGHGARSTIYAVTDRRQQVYAMKHVVKRDTSDQRFLDQALEDHRTASTFDHCRLRRSYKVIRHRKLIRTREIALLMELVDGLTLEEVRTDDLIEVCEWCKQIAMGLKAMHDAGWVHADIKPNNILVTDGGAVKIIDFGQSCRTGTEKDRIQGTPDFIAPEQVLREPLTPRTDIFNLGATMYWLLTQRHIPTLIPKGEPGLSYRKSDACPPPRELNPDVPPALSSLVMSCIQRRPGERPETMIRVFSRLEIAAMQLCHSF